MAGQFLSNESYSSIESDTDECKSNCASESSRGSARYVKTPTKIFRNSGVTRCSPVAAKSPGSNKSFSGRVIYVRGTTNDEIRKIISHNSTSSVRAVTNSNYSTSHRPSTSATNEAYESFTDGEDEEIISDYLRVLCEKDAIDIINEVKLDDSTFNSYLRQEKMDKDTLFAMVRAVNKICQSGNHELITEELYDSGLPDAILYYLETSYRRKKRGSSRRIGEFFENLMSYYSLAMKCTAAEERERWEELIRMTEHAVRLLNGRYDHFRENEIIKQLQNMSNGCDDAVALAPRTTPACGTFRDLCILLTSEDLDRPGLDDQHLREIKLNGRYASVEDYLETWFRLGRENFAAPIRFGIRQYLQSKAYAAKPILKYGRVKIYENVRFEGVTKTRTGRVCLLVNFDFIGKLKRFKWEATKRLTPGSLLIFSADSFESFFFGFIVERTLQRLLETELLVVLDDQTPLNETLFDASFVMVETEVSYEQYRNCMTALKCFDARSFPFKEYLIDAKFVAKRPKYVTLLLDCDGWPRVAELFDSWQRAALKLVLERDVCLIRGAPGTGKTFLTVQIVRILLKMTELYPNTIKTPLLIIYATAAALDQFLAQISHFQSVAQVVRIAGRSNDDAMRQFDLRGRVKLTSVRAEQRQSELVAKIDELAKCRERIDAINSEIARLKSDRGIVKWSIVSRAFKPNQKKVLKNDEDLLNWLLDGKEPLFYAHEETPEAECDSELGSIDDEFGDEWTIENEDEVCRRAECVENNAEFYCCTLASLEESLRKTADECGVLKKKAAQAEKKRLEERVKVAQSKLNTMKLYGKGGDYEECRSDELQFATSAEAWTLPVATRWICYWNWIYALKTAALKEQTAFEYEYRRLKREYETAKRREDLTVMRSANVVGATIAEAVAFQDVLKELKPAIVVCEEANQILETNLVAVLTNECQQLVLSGDEKQSITNKAEVLKLQKKYNYGSSLFDRLLNNNVKNVMLNKQYVMRPQIVRLLKPTMYPSMEMSDEDDGSERIAGMTNYVYFMDHNVAEEEDGTGLKRNNFEAGFAIELARYLVAQGNEPRKITLLSSHEGQVYTLREVKRKYETLRNVNCYFVDDYAGRTNDIAILSLVRSNDKGQIGLLADDNRTCVLLSRATKALYVVGNVQMMARCSKLWHELKNTAEALNAIGTKMALRCETHDKITYVSAVEDFDRLKRGGCAEICGQTLACGHRCKKECHFADKKHADVVCEERCSKKCARNLHQCALRCHEKCQPCDETLTVTLPCGHDAEIRCDDEAAASTGRCAQEVNEKSPLCGHTVKKRCGESFEEAKCAAKCGARLECGHVCSLKCHRTDADHAKYICKKDCSRRCAQNHKCTKKCYEKCGGCEVRVTHTADCGHEYETTCSAGETKNFVCRKRCLKICPRCGASCAKKCYQQCPPCRTPVVKTIEECGHEIEAKCGDDPPKRSSCREECERVAACGHPCKNECGEACVNEDCEVLVRLDGMKGLCGHNFINVECMFRDDVADKSYELGESVEFCDAKCTEKLACGHMCQGTCKECVQGKFHKRCLQKCQKILACGHKCKSYCERFCPPCDQPCPYNCMHENCPNKCGALCATPCSKKCEWRCKHTACTRICGQMCNRPKCYEKCDKKLKCEHPCIGFCGEPCPPKCRVCDQDKLSDMPGNVAYKPDARFVVLVDCNHVFESRELEKYFKAALVGEVMMKGCPSCKAPVTKTLRFMNDVRMMHLHINCVKLIVYGEKSHNACLRMDIIDKLVSFRRRCNSVGLFCNKIDVLETINFYTDILKGKSRFGTVDLNQIRTIEVCVTIMEGFMARVPELAKVPPEFAVTASFSIGDLMSHLERALKETNVRMNIQHLIDLRDELMRFLRVVDFLNIVEFATTISFLNGNLALIGVCDEIRSQLLELKRYTTASDEKMLGLFNVLESMAQIRLPISLSKLNVKLPELEDATDERNVSRRWFVCSKRHYYNVPKDESGRCPDCNPPKGKK